MIRKFPKVRLASCRIMLCIPFIGCLNTDFGRVRPSLRSENMHTWMGPAVTEHYGRPYSEFPLTDNERLLRDLAYPLIAPPYDQQRWYSVVYEYGGAGVFRPEWWVFDVTAYTQSMFASKVRSTETHYNRLTDDIRNDIERIGPFAMTARSVSDMDVKRGKSLRYVSNATPPERGNALARIDENQLIVRWVHQSLTERMMGYRFALEKLVIAAPSPRAAEAERELNLMAMRVAEAGLVPRGSSGPWITK